MQCHKIFNDETSYKCVFPSFNVVIQKIDSKNTFSSHVWILKLRLHKILRASRS